MAEENASAVAEPPPKPAETKPPAFKPPTAGEKFREAFSKLESSSESPPPKVEPAPKEGKISGEEDSTIQPPTPPAPTKPSSALEAAIGTEKIETEGKPTADDSEFDKVETPTKDNWHQARTRIKELNKQVETLSAQGPKQDTAALEAVAAERDEYKQRLADQETRLKAINAEYSDEFQGLKKERDKAISKIASRMKYIGASEKAQDLIDALNLPDSRFKTAQIKEALSELEADDKSAIRVLIEGLDTVDEKITDFRKDLPAQWEKIQTERDRKIADIETENLKALDREFGKVINDLPKTLVRLRQVPEDVPGAEGWNKSIQEAIGRALSALKPNGTDFKQTVQIAVKGELYDGLWADHIAQYKELQEARNRLKEFDAAGPDFKGTTKPKPGQEAKKPSQKFHEAMAAQQATSPE